MTFTLPDRPTERRVEFVVPCDLDWLREITKDFNLAGAIWASPGVARLLTRVVEG